MTAIKRNARNDRTQNHEKLLLVAHLAHTEIHICELIERCNNDDVRKHLEQKLSEVTDYRVKTMKSIGGNIDIVWCTVKHLLLSYIHALELVTKGYHEYIDISKNIMKLVDELLSNKAINEDNISQCPRCEEDSK